MCVCLSLSHEVASVTATSSVNYLSTDLARKRSNYTKKLEKKRDSFAGGVRKHVERRYQHLPGYGLHG